MRVSELFRLVWLNINQNKFKSVMTSIGIVAGAATIVMVIGVGRGGQMDIADQFAELNAGAIDVSYKYAGEETSGGKTGVFSFGGMMNGNYSGAPQKPDGEEFQKPEGTNDSQGSDVDAPQRPEANDSQRSDVDAPQRPEANDSQGSDGGTPQKTDGEEFQRSEEAGDSDKMASIPDSDNSEEEDAEQSSNVEQIILSASDVENIETSVTGITGATISYSSRSAIEGGNLTSAQTYTIAGVFENFADIGKLSLSEGCFLDETDNDLRSKVCVIGATVAKEVFGSTEDAIDSTVYIDDRSYTVIGVLASSSSVVSGISPDTSVLVPYQTGIKYITGEEIDPTITVIAEDVNTLQSVISNVKTVLEESYPDASFTFEDSGSKMKAAEASNRTLTMLLSAMAAIVFLVGGIGIMNVLFVSVKERTNEIGILKAIGTPRTDILLEFLAESTAISLIGGILGIAISFGITPIISHFEVRVEVNAVACLAALGFAVLTGTMFGIYPAWKASRLEPVEALNAE